MKKLFAFLVFIALFTLALNAQVAVTGNEYISGQAMSQRALFQYLHRQRQQDYNRVLTSGALNPTGTEIQIKANVNYLIDGYFGVFAASDTPELTASIQASGTRRIYLLSVNAAGTLTCTPGVAVAPALTPQPPEVPANQVAFGYLNVLSGEPFTLGTTDFNTTVTVTKNISRLNPLGEENFQGL